MTSQTIDTPAADLPVAATQTESFQTGQVATIAGGHFMHDTFGAFLAPCCR